MTARRPAGELLTARALGRATLARQHLVTPSGGTPLELVRHLVGLQAQAPWAPYVGLWSRLAAFAPAELADRLLDRTAARIVVMRGTIHLLTADDAVALPCLLRPLLERDLHVNATHAPALRGLDREAIAAAARTLVEAEPLGATELGARLAQTWPDAPPASLVHAARALLPLVQVPPRAVWGRTGATRWTTATVWLGRTAPDLSAPGASGRALEDLLLRYLGAFGPASVADAQQWSGLTGLGPVLERLRPRLVTFRSEPGPGARSGRELFDLPGSPRPAPELGVPVRFLPEFDNLTVAHADRTRLVTPEHRRRLWRPNGAVPGTVLVDGVVAGAWQIRLDGKGKGKGTGSAAGEGSVATLVVEPFAPLSRSDSDELEALGQRLVRFAADTAANHRVLIEPVA